MKRRIRCLAGAALVLVSAAAQAAPAGHLDPTFAVGGKRTVALPDGQTPWYSKMARDDAGRIYLVDVRGGNFDNPEGRIAITRLHHDGALDTSYGSNGHAITAGPSWFGVGVAVLASLARQPDDKFLLGFVYGPDVCRIRADGSLDTAFGNASTPGCADTGIEHFEVNALAVQPDGRIIVAGADFPLGPERGLVLRLNPDGSLDDSFGTDGVFAFTEQSQTALYAVALMPNGDIVAAGDIFQSNSNMLVLRLRADDGQPVTDFGIWGLAIGAFEAGGFNHDHVNALAILPDGGVVAAGYAQMDGHFSAERPAVLKLTASGMPDESFGPGGRRTYDVCTLLPSDASCSADATSVAMLPGGKLVVGGRTETSPDNEGFFALRILANGTLDPGFGNMPAMPGLATVLFEPFDPDKTYANSHSMSLEGQRVLLGGEAYVDTGSGGPPSQFAVARLDHGIAVTFTVTPKAGLHGMLSPGPQQVTHSSRAEFAVLPDPGYIVDRIETGPGQCGGGMDGDVLVTAPVVASCDVKLSFERLHVFVDGYE